MTPDRSELGAQGLWLDVLTEPWTGAMRGMGGVSVSDDGGFSTLPATGGDIREANRALTSGWAGLLSWVRRGYRLGNAICVSDPSHEDRSLLLCGDASETSQAAVHLTGRGWRLVSDRPTPLAWAEHNLLGFPRPEPLIIGSRLGEASGLAMRHVRHDSDAVTVDVPRAQQPTVIAATVVLEARRPGDAAVTELSGTAKFEACTRVLLMGVLTATDLQGSRDEPGNPDRLIAEHVRLSGLPFAVIRTTDADDSAAMDGLLEWWREVVGR